MLPIRVLHYSRTEMFWECLTSTAREGSLDVNKNVLNSGLIVDSDGDDLKASLYITTKDPFALDGGSFSLWYRIVKLYTRKALSNLSDKVAAISGIAAMIAEKEKACYRFGIWEQDIAGLTWTIGAKKALALEYYPSWSWLSWDGPINYRIYTEPRFASKNDVEVIGTGIDLDKKAEDGHLMLCGLVKAVRCLTLFEIDKLNKIPTEGEWVPPKAMESYQWLRLYDDDFWIGVYDDERNLLGMASMDRHLDRYAPRKLGPGGDTCIAICICERFCDSITGSPNIQRTVDVATYFLLMHPEDGTHGRWKRVGLGVTREIRDTSLKESSKMFGSSSRQQICLI